MRKMLQQKYVLLLEATRRWLNDNPRSVRGLTTAWLGLGSATRYRTAINAGLMTCATAPNPGYSTWWKLTPAGAKVVRRWLDAGLKIEHFMQDWTGQYQLMPQSGVGLDREGLAIIEENLP